MILIESEFNLFLKNYGIYLIIGLMAVVVLSLLFLFLSYKKNKIPEGTQTNKKHSQEGFSKDEFLLSLGGKENITSSILKGSRIVLTLTNYEIIDKVKLQELGVTSFIQMSNKLTLIIEKDADKIYNQLFN